MSKTPGKGFPGCESCLNREHDPFQCKSCEDESNWEGSDTIDDEPYEDMTLDEFRDFLNNQ